MNTGSYFRSHSRSSTNFVQGVNENGGNRVRSGGSSGGRLKLERVKECITNASTGATGRAQCEILAYGCRPVTRIVRQLLDSSADSGVFQYRTATSYCSAPNCSCMSNRMTSSIIGFSVATAQAGFTHVCCHCQTSFVKQIHSWKIGDGTQA